jgi:hypothetical protein
MTTPIIIALSILSAGTLAGLIHFKRRFVESERKLEEANRLVIALSEENQRLFRRQTLRGDDVLDAEYLEID